MITISKLEEIRTETMSKLKIRKNSDGRKIVIGMGECGLRAGAREVMKSILNDFSENGIDDVSVMLCDCEGKCDFEPVVHFYEADGSRITYENVTPETAKDIVKDHVLNTKYVFSENVH